MIGTVLERLRRWPWPASLIRLLGPQAQPPGVGVLPEGLRVYAIGDIHGEVGLLDDLLRCIALDLRRRPADRALAVFLGDYIDRGPDSRGVVQRLVAADLPLAFEALRGNHEDLMLQALAAPDAFPHWCQMGGVDTLRSYGIHVERGRKVSDKLRRGLIEALPAAHLAFLRSTRLSLSVGDYFFAHAGARPGVPLDQQTAEDLMWIREDCYGSSFDFGKVLVHGHTPRKRPENLPRRINVDTGAFKWGVLTAVVLEADQRRFLSTRA